MSRFRAQLSAATDLTLPRQGWSDQCDFVMAGYVALLAVVLLAIFSVLDMPWHLLSFAWLIPVLLGGYLGHRAAAPYRPDFEARYVTVGDLTRALITWNVLRIREEYGKLTPSDVWAILQQALVEHAYVDPSVIRRDTKLADIIRD